MTYNFADMKAEFRITHDGDDWGHVMQWLFSIADEIYFNRDFPVPVDWEFQPSILGPSNDPDDYTTEIVSNADDESLLRFGVMLNRAAACLRAKGKSY